jgi:quinohemoprotein amine dehydrogenase
MLRQVCRLTLLGTICAVSLVHAQAPDQTPAAKAPAEDEGIPIRNELVQAKCGACHKADAQGRMSRISYRRATPENWERTIKRMATLNNVALEPADARNILKYLADRQGLSPEEVRPIAFDAERRVVDYTYAADKETADLCSSCHSMARVLSERRTKQEWELLVAMHRGYYPLVDNQPMNNGPGFRRSRPAQTEPAADGRPPDNRQPMDKAIDHLSKALPLRTADWSAWSAVMQTPRLAGRWAVTGTTAGKGDVYGEVVVTADPSAPDSFTTETRYTIARTGETVARSGKALVYTGYQWRGRGTAPGSNQPWREVLFVDRDRRAMSGRWFTGAYDETGIDVRLVRLTSEPAVFGTSVSAIKTSGTAMPLKIFGANLPTTLRPEDVAFGQGIKVGRIVSARADEIAVEVDVAPDAPIGPRDLSIAGSVKTSALVVYDKIDGIKVTPQAGMARVGGANFPKQLQQFEAVGINYGPDGKPDTTDDVNLGLVKVKWSVEEYTATFGDDDAQFVGAIDQTGLFTPNLDGPNPKRSGNRNNVGDVWVVAELTDSTTPASTDPKAMPKTLRARAHLLVTVPLYMAWFSEGGNTR